VNTGLNRSAFDNKGVTFEHHVKREHNMWNYIYFLVLLNQKDKTEYTGSECYVSRAVKVSNLQTAFMEELCTCICYSIIGKEPGLVSKTQNIVA
jgi:hypothetical protein